MNWFDELNLMNWFDELIWWTEFDELIWWIDLMNWIWWTDLMNWIWWTDLMNWIWWTDLMVTNWVYLWDIIRARKRIFATIMANLQIHYSNLCSNAISDKKTQNVRKYWRAIKNGQFRETGNIGYTRRRKAKQKHNTICIN
jgi:hypothetical protein